MGRFPEDDLPRRSRVVPVLAGVGAVALVTLGVLGAAGIFPTLRSTVDPELLAQVQNESPSPVQPEPLAAEPEVVVKQLAVSTFRLARNQTLAQALFAMKLAETEVRDTIQALESMVPFRKLRPGDQLRLERRAEDNSIARLVYRQGPADEWIVQPGADGVLRGEKRAVEVTTEMTQVAVTISNSLYEALQKVGEDPGLAVDTADILAWDVDFYLDVRAGDSFRVVVEKVFADGRFLRYGNVLAVEYAGSAAGRKRLFRYADPSGQTAYYDDDGNSARRGFLKSPLKYAHITSRYGNRLHPVFGYHKEHQGIDYRAPEGTPVWAVGDGTVEQSNQNNGCGKQVTLRHRNGLETIYCHLSRATVSAGNRVAQKDVIGYVGQTGIATGPHLHYAIKRHGVYFNPMQLQIPRGAPVPDNWKADFLEKITPLREKLDAKPTV